MNSTFSCLAIDSPGVTAATISSTEKEQMPPPIRDPAQKISGLMECRALEESRRRRSWPMPTAASSSCRWPFQTANGNEISMGRRRGLGPTHWHLLAAARSMRFGNCFGNCSSPLSDAKMLALPQAYNAPGATCFETDPVCVKKPSPATWACKKAGTCPAVVAEFPSRKDQSAV
jgi:hypothetical protein